MKLTVCIGSSCHLKGSRQVVETLQRLIAENGLGEKVELGGTFCMGKCQQGRLRHARRPRLLPFSRYDGGILQNGSPSEGIRTLSAPHPALFIPKK